MPRSALAPPRRRRRAPWLFTPLLVLIVVPGWYDRVQPTVFGLPCFVAVEFGLVLLGALLTGAVYLLQRGDEPPMTDGTSPVRSSRPQWESVADESAPESTLVSENTGVAERSPAAGHDGAA